MEIGKSMKVVLKLLSWVRSTGLGLILTVLCCGLFPMGCEHSYGIVRRARLSSYPPPKCVSQALREVPRVENLEHTYSKTWVEETQRWRSQHAYYNRDSVRIQLGIFYESGRVRFLQGYLLINKKPTIDEIRMARELMKDVEGSLEEHCHVVELSARVEEYCTGMKCE